MDTTRYRLAPLVNRIIKKRMRINFVSESEALILLQLNKLRSQNVNLIHTVIINTLRERDLESEPESFP